MRPYLLPTLLLPLFAGQDDDARQAADAGASEPAQSHALVVERGDQLALVIPEHEVLDFAVTVDVAVLGEAGLGSFQLSTGTEDYRSGIATENAGQPTGKKVGWIRGYAVGSYANYRLDHVIEVRLLPQEWPRVIYRNTQTGSENRRSELMYGTRRDKLSSWFRKDRHCKGCERPEHFIEGTWPFSKDHHCDKCRRGEHRVWKSPTVQPIPKHSVDMLSAILLARSMITEDLKKITFPMLDKDRFWHVTITRAGRKVIETPAGKFYCREVKFDPRRAGGADDDDEERFRGLFGIHGTLSIWLHDETGVPVLIEGVVPAGPLDVDVALALKGFSGTPDGFGVAE